MTELDIRRLDGTLLLVFRELMRQRQATAAAARLGLSQSGVSHALVRLREIFDDPLFLRRPHGLEPTRRAADLAPQIEALISLAHEAVGGGANFDPATTTRRFRIGAAEYLVPLIGPALLRIFEREAPRASVAFDYLLGESALAAVEHGDIELALGAFDRSTAAGDRQPLIADEYAVVARAGHPDLTQGLDLQTFHRLPHVIVSATGEATSPADTLLAALGVRRRVIAAVPRFLTAFTLVGATDALAFAPRPLAQRFAEAFALQVLQPPFESLSLNISAVRRAGPAADPGAEWLLQQVRNAVHAH